MYARAQPVQMVRTSWRVATTWQSCLCANACSVRPDPHSPGALNANYPLWRHDGIALEISLLAILSDVDLYSSPFEFGAIHGGNRVIGRGVVVEGYEAKSARALCFTV